MIYVSNAFSLGMIARDNLSRVRITPMACRPVLDGLAWQSAVGHADTAAVLGVPMARITVALKPGDVLYVAQLRGGRLPEGCTTLPAGFEFDWIAVQFTDME